MSSQSGFSIVQLASALQHGTSPDKVSSRQMKRTMSDLDMFDRGKMLTSVEQRLEIIRGAQYREKISDIRMAIKFQKDKNAFATKVAGMVDGNIKFNLKGVIKDADNLQKDLDKLIIKFQNPNEKSMHIFEGKVKQQLRGGVNLDQAMTNVLMQTDPFSTDAIYTDQRKVDENAGVKLILDEYNKVVGGAIKFAEDQTILNMDELASADSPLVKAGLMSAIQAEEIFNQRTGAIKQYQIHREKAVDRLNEIKLHKAEIEENLNQLREDAEGGLPLTDEGMAARLEALSSQYQAYEDFAHEGSGFDDLDADHLADDRKRIEGRRKSIEGLERFRERLLAEDPSGAEYSKYEQKLAQAISNPNFRAWAADHGFDRLGRADRDEDGIADPGSYIAGRQDFAAIRAFNRQQKLGAGRYGFRSIGTGDIVRFELDGQIYEGERLKFHAADPAGTMRIMVGPGEPMIITRDQVPSLEVIDSLPQRASPLSRRATRRYRMMQSRIEDAKRRSRGTDPASTLDAAQVAEGGPNDGLFITKDGRYISQDEFDAARQAKIDESAVTARIVGDNYYLVTGERVFRLDATGPDGSLVPTDITNDSAREGDQAAEEYAKAFSLSDPRRVGLSAVDEDGNVITDDNGNPVFDRFITLEDIESGNLAALEIEGTADSAEDTDEKRQMFDEADEKRRKSVTAESLGYDLTDVPFEGSAGAPVRERVRSMGFELRYMGEPPKSEVQVREEADIDPIAPPADIGDDPTVAEPKDRRTEDDLRDDAEAKEAEEAKAAAAKADEEAAKRAVEETPATPAEGKPGEGVIPSAIADAPPAPEVDPKAEAAATAGAAADRFKAEGAAALQAARAAATAAQPDAKAKAKAYRDMAIAAGVEPAEITMFTDDERKAHQLALAGQRTQPPKSSETKRQKLVAAFKETGLDEPTPAPQPKPESPPEPAEVSGDPDDDAKPVSAVVAPGAKGPPPKKVEFDQSALEDLAAQLELSRQMKQELAGGTQQ